MELIEDADTVDTRETTMNNENIVNWPPFHTISKTLHVNNGFILIVNPVILDRILKEHEHSEHILDGENYLLNISYGFLSKFTELNLTEEETKLFTTREDKILLTFLMDLYQEKYNIHPDDILRLFIEYLHERTPYQKRDTIIKYTHRFDNEKVITGKLLI